MNALTVAGDPDVYVDTCLTRVCDEIGIPDEGSRPPFLAAVDAAADDGMDVEVVWTLRLGGRETPPPAVEVAWLLTGGGAPPVAFLGAPPVAFLGAPAPGSTPRRPIGVHPAVLVCGAIAIAAAVAALLVHVSTGNPHRRALPDRVLAHP